MLMKMGHNSESHSATLSGFLMQRHICVKPLRIREDLGSRCQEPNEFFPSQKCCSDSLSVCPTHRVYIHTLKNDHVRTITFL